MLRISTKLFSNQQAGEGYHLEPLRCTTLALTNKLKFI